MAREDLRDPPERPVTPVRQGRQASQAFARRPCVSLRQRTPPRDYRRREELKDPMFREPSLHNNNWERAGEIERERRREKENTLLSRTTSRMRGGGQ